MTQVVETGRVVSQVVTPNGLEIFFQDKPKRLYRIRERWVGGPLEDLREEYSDWVEVPSASSITDVISKPLQWWGMKVGVEGVSTLYRTDDDMAVSLLDALGRGDVDAIVNRLTAKKLTVNHDTKATTRGTNVHKALEAFAETKAMPDPKFYPETESGYIAGLAAFINDAHPHPLMSEVMVASLDGYAGRFDLVCNLDFAGKVVTKLYPKKPPVRTQLSGSWLIDLKTSSGVWPSYHFQVAGYLNALEECGYPVPEHAGILRVTNDGRYELVECNAMYSDFQNALALYQSVKRIGK